VDQRLEKLAALRNESRRDPRARKRWQANYDLVVAQLLKMKAMLLQYRYYAGWLQRRKRFPTPKERGKRYVWYEIAPVPHQDRKKAKFMGGSRERAALERCRKALENVERRHRGTPWAAIARSERDNLIPYRLVMHPQSRPSPGPPVVRPKL